MKASINSVIRILAVACLWIILRGLHTDAAFGDQLLKLLPTDGAALDHFGGSVGVSLDTAIVGADLDDNPLVNSGSAYLFDMTAGTQLQLAPNDGGQEQFFGTAVGISGNNAIVGAVSAWNASLRTGAAYLFDVSDGSQIAKLTASDGDASDAFGAAVAISGDRVVVGARYANAGFLDAGSAYLFDTSGSQLAILARTDTAPGDRFGNSVGVSGDLAIVGAPRDNIDGMSDSGSAYLFDLDAGGQPVRIVPEDGAAGDNFGFSVAMSGNLAIVGAFHDDDNGSDSGSAYLFDAASGVQLRKLLPDDGGGGDFFGRSVAISGNLAVVGSHKDDDHGASSGSAYLFDVTTGEQLAKFTASDGAAFDGFGVAVAVDDDDVVVGSELDDDLGGGSGSAYVFDATGPFFDADFDGDGDVDDDDLGKWQGDFGGPGSDADGDGDSDGADFLVWQQQHGSGVTPLASSREVPEPGTLALLIAALGVLALRRRI